MRIRDQGSGSFTSPCSIITLSHSLAGACVVGVTACEQRLPEGHIASRVAMLPPLQSGSGGAVGEQRGLYGIPLHS